MNPSMSGDGRYIVFESFSNNVSEESRKQDCDTDGDGYLDGQCNSVLLFDRDTGETSLISVGRNNFSARGNAGVPMISDNGRYIVYMADADNLDSEDDSWCFTNEIRWSCINIFVYDRETEKTRWITRGLNGEYPNETSLVPTISADGRYIVYMSRAGNLVEGDTNNAQDIFLYDQKTQQTTLISMATDGTKGNNFSTRPVISADGQFVAYTSFSDNLVPNDTNQTGDVFVYTIATGETTRVSVGTEGQQADAFSELPTLSNNGQWIVFDSAATNLSTEDTNTTCDNNGDKKFEENCRDVYLYDQQSGTVQRVSVSSGGAETDKLSLSGHISGDGSTVVFASAGAGLVENDNNEMYDIFIKDLESGELTRIVNLEGEEGNFNTGIISNPFGLRPNFDLSDDGRYIVFSSLASNFVEGDTNGDICDPRTFDTFEPNCNDVFLYDRETGEITLISTARKER